MSYVVARMEKVYQGSDRRYFTKDAAYRSIAWALYAKKYPCECEFPDQEVGDPGFTCTGHSGDERVLGIVKRLAYRLKKADKREAKR